MATTNEAPPSGTRSGANPAAPRPPVAFRIHLPDAWHTLDLDPATADASVEAFTAAAVAARPELAGARGAARRGLRDLAAVSRAQGVLLLSFLAGWPPGAAPPDGVRGDPADLVGASVSVAWRRLPGSGGVPAAGVADALATAPPGRGEALADRAVAVVDLSAGPAAYLSTVQLAPLPGGRGERRVAVSQFLVPAPGLPWLCAVTACTADLDLAGGVDAVADGVAASLVVGPGG